MEVNRDNPCQKKNTDTIETILTTLIHSEAKINAKQTFHQLMQFCSIEQIYIALYLIDQKFSKSIFKLPDNPDVYVVMYVFEDCSLFLETNNVDSKLISESWFSWCTECLNKSNTCPHLLGLQLAEAESSNIIIQKNLSHSEFLEILYERIQ